jgi:hypothetical protein
LRSTVSMSSPEMLSSRSTAIRLSARLESLASLMIATGFLISGAKPKLVVSPLSVGAAQLFLPSRPPSTRPIVPFPPRLGPAARNIFCRLVSKRAKAEQNKRRQLIGVDWVERNLVVDRGTETLGSRPRSPRVGGGSQRKRDFSMSLCSVFDTDRPR